MQEEPAEVGGERQARRHTLGRVTLLALSALVAIKFTPPGGTVRVVLSSDTDDVLLTVSDSGMGIAADEQADLFSRFHRTKAAKKGAIPGTGLGLSIVRSIVAAHAGTVTFESTVGAGTTFVIRLPRAPVAALTTAA